jgi:hypothetical protein
LDKAPFVCNGCAKKSTAVWISFTTEPQLLIANTGRSLQRPEPVSTSQKMTSRFWMN